MTLEQVKSLRILLNNADYARETSEFEKHAYALMLYLSAVLDGFKVGDTSMAQIPTVLQRNLHMKPAHERGNSTARELSNYEKQ